MESSVVIAGKYRLLRKLGQGGMGSVWYAEHLTLHSAVAIKLIDPSIANNEEALGRFLREAQAAASLRSPHVVQILDHGVDSGAPYIVMELLEGESLADRLTRVRRMSPIETARIMQQVARAVARAHEAGIVHRDLKPDNIFIVHNDDDEVAKVLDFGIAKSNTTGGLTGSASGGTRTGAVLGTPYYMSPEQAEGAKSLDGRSDIWAMGVISYECILGARPFDEATLGGLLLAICARPPPIPSERGPVPAGFDLWFTRVCARDPNQRYANAREAMTDLRQLCENPVAVSSSNAFGGGGTHVFQHGASGPVPGPVPTPPYGAQSSQSVPGQSVAGYASTRLGNDASNTQGKPSASKAWLGWLVAVGVLLVVAGVFAVAWPKLGNRPEKAVSSAAPEVTSSPVAATPPPLVVPAMPAAPSPVPPVVSAAPSASTTTPPAAARTPPISKGHAATHAAQPPAPAPAPVTPAPTPKPAPADARVNLGI